MLIKEHFKTKIKNRCILTGNAFSTLRRFRISRMEFKRAVTLGTLPGVRRSS